MTEETAVSVPSLWLPETGTTSAGGCAATRRATTRDLRRIMAFARSLADLA
jgi:hypothetical protein